MHDGVRAADVAKENSALGLSGLLVCTTECGPGRDSAGEAVVQGSFEFLSTGAMGLSLLRVDGMRTVNVRVLQIMRVDGWAVPSRAVACGSGCTTVAWAGPSEVVQGRSRAKMQHQANAMRVQQLLHDSQLSKPNNIHR